MSLVKFQSEFMKDLAKLIEYIYDYGYIVTGGELWRPPEMQKIYVQTGRSKTYRSQHLKRLAIDLNFFKPISLKDRYKYKSGVVLVNGVYYVLTYRFEDIEPFGKFWEALSDNNRWGGYYKTFKDVPHFEKLDKIRE